MSYSIDVTEENFASEVMQASQQVPVLVDFWATWCGPCQTLMPLLSRLADEYQGQFRLAKVEIDQNQQLAQQFAVRSVPTVKLVKNGKIVDEFTGALPESAIREFIDKHLDRQSDALMQEALMAYQSGDSDAIKRMQDIINSDPDNQKLRVQYVHVLMKEQQYDDAKVILQHLPADVRDNEEVRALTATLEFIDILQDADDMQSLQQRIEQDPADSEARYQLSAHLMVNNQHEAAMEQLLEIVRRDRKYADDAGRTGLLRLFDLMGNQGELVSRYRRKLAQALN